MNIKDKFQTPLNAEISVVAVEKSCLMWLYTPLIHNMLLDEISNGAISVKKTHKNNSDKKEKKIWANNKSEKSECLSDRLHTII